MMNCHIKAFLWLIVSVANLPCYAWDSCSNDLEKKLCSDERHIMCYPESVPLGKTKFVALCPLTRKIRDSFLGAHNEVRNLLASGTEKNAVSGFVYPKAARMREVLWDDELAYLASVHASRCNMFHDHCRSTARISIAGQNLYYFASSKMRNFSDLPTDAVKTWYSEINNTKSVEVVRNFSSSQAIEGLAIGHFTVMINDQVSHVGCATAYCIDEPKKMHYYHITCNYDYSNILHQRVYMEGEVHSQCKQWDAEPSATYKHLCTNNGTLFPNNWDLSSHFDETQPTYPPVRL